MTLQEAPASAVALTGESVELLEPDYQTAKFDLSLLAGTGPDGLTTAWEYNTDLFDGATIERLADQVPILLEALAAPDTRLSDLPLLTPGERQRLLGDGTAPATEFGRSTDVAGWFAEQAAKTPAATALIAGDQRWTYAALNAREPDGAALRLGIGPEESLVGVLLERSPELVVSVLAILKAGAAYVPLDPGAPPRLSAMLADSPLALVVTTAAHADRLTDPRLARLDLAAAEEPIARESPADFPSPAGPDPFYGIFTSGSTGRPKLAGVRGGGLRTCWAGSSGTSRSPRPTGCCWCRRSTSI